MIKNEVRFCTEEDIINNVNIMLYDHEMLNIFIDGKATPTMTQTVEAIYKSFDIERELYDHYMYDQAFDFLSDVFDLTSLNSINQVNLIVFNFKYHHNKWKFQKRKYKKEETLEFYNNICKYFENEVVGCDSNGSRKSFDVYICEDVIDVDKIVELINYPSKSQTLDRLIER